MKRMQDLVEQLSGSELTAAVIEQMLEHIDGFRKNQKSYLFAVHRLKTELGDPVDGVVDAIQKRAASDLLFAGFLGMKMNYDHFRDPMTPNCTWSQVDYSDYLREDLAHSLPDYRAAETVLHDFYQSLTAEQKKIYSAITEYDTHLQTVGPKLAHYYGYLLGDTLLYQLLPGYRADTALTYKYNLMLTQYFGKSFLPLAL